MKPRVIIFMPLALGALGAVYYFTSRPEPPAPVEERHYVWDVEMDQLQKLEIRLTDSGMSKAWVKHADKFWYFDEPDGPRVDVNRWGGGVPLLLSGPGANRVLTPDATDEQLEVYGLVEPSMLIDLVLEDGRTISIEVGDRTLDGENYYIRLEDSRKVFTIDYTWYYVLARLVLDPPYPKLEEAYIRPVVA